MPADPSVLMNMLSSLESVKGSGGDRWQAKCPCHQDDRRSLSIHLKSGGVYVKCFAGCDFKQILERLGVIRQTDVTPNMVRVEHYSYADSQGRELYRVVRYEPKTFRVFRMNGGTEVSGIGEGERVLYRMPELYNPARMGDPVWVVEGEKDVHTCERFGLLATTKAGGVASAWLPQFSQALNSRNVIVLADNDEAGIRGAFSIGHSICRHGVGAVVKVVLMPSSLKPKGDVTDLLESGPGMLQLLYGIVSETETLKFRAPAPDLADRLETLAHLVRTGINPTEDVLSMLKGVRFNG